MPTRKSRLDLMPKQDVMLAILPAKVHIMFLPPCPEIYQAGAKILDLHPTVKYLVHEVIKPIKFLCQPAEFRAPTISSGSLHGGPKLRSASKDLAPDGKNLLQEWAYGRERCPRLDERETFG